MLIITYMYTYKHIITISYIKKNDLFYTNISMFNIIFVFSSVLIC